MHMDQPLRPGSLVQVVNVLSNEQQLAAPLAIQSCERPMRFIGLHGSKLRPSRVVEAMHQLRITTKRLRRCDIFDTVPLPKPVWTAEGRKTTLGGYACAGKDHDIAYSHRAPLAAESQ